MIENNIKNRALQNYKSLINFYPHVYGIRFYFTVSL